MTLVRILSARMLSGFLGLSYVFYCCLAQASTPEYEVSKAKGKAELRLRFNEAPNFSEQRSEMGVVLKFKHSLGQLDLSSAQKKLQPWVQSLWSSYDSILIKPAAGVSLVAKQSNAELTLVFSKAAKSSVVPRASQTSNQLAVERAKAILTMESGQPLQAKEKLEQLMKRSPRSVPVKLDLARVEEKLNNWRNALTLYNQSLAIKPRSTSISEAKTRLLRQYGNQVSVGAEYMEFGDASSQLILNMFRGQKLLKERTLLAIDYDRIDAEEDLGVRRVNGALAPFDAIRHRLSLQVATAFQKGEQRLSVFSGSKTLGLGWAYAQASNYGLSEFDVEWKRPWFETPEAIISYGHRKRLALKHGNTLRKKLTVYGEISLNRYGLEDFSKAASSQRVELGGRYPFQVGNEKLSAGYSIDLENVKVETTRRNRFSAPYAPLPLLDREQHVLDIGWMKKIKPDLHIDTQLGIEHDRKRRATAPFSRLMLKATPKKDFTWNISLQSGLSNYRGQDERFFRVGGGAHLVFLARILHQLAEF